MSTLLLSENHDPSTDDVIDWLTFYGVSFIRHNYEDTDFEISNIYITNENIDYQIRIRNKIFNSSDITSVWFRRGHFLYYPQIKETDTRLHNGLNEYLKKEFDTLRDFVSYLLNSKKVIGIDYFNINKLTTLYLAAKTGLNIPFTFIVNTKKNLVDHLRFDSLVTKGIENSVRIKIGNGNAIHTFTNEINKNNLSECPPFFFNSLFQKNIKKIFELRIFFIEDQFYSMALFSQQTDVSKIDCRIQQSDNQYRCCPHVLPIKLKNKLKLLMKKLGLNTGSIDMIYGTDHKYYFLEINPVGQFQFVSKICNYNIEKVISKKLSNGKFKKGIREK